MKLLNYLAVMLFVFSVNAQNVINQTYLDVPLNKIGEFVDLHEKVTNASIGEGRTIARSFVYRHWYGSGPSIVVYTQYATAADAVNDDPWNALGQAWQAASEERKKEASKIIKNQHSNFMKKWLKEDDEKLLDKLEGEDKINYNELENELGRSIGGIRSKCKKIIYENFEEESWEQLIDIANLEKSKRGF